MRRAFPKKPQTREVLVAGTHKLTCVPSNPPWNIAKFKEEKPISRGNDSIVNNLGPAGIVLDAIMSLIRQTYDSGRWGCCLIGKLQKEEDGAEESHLPKQEIEVNNDLWDLEYRLMRKSGKISPCIVDTLFSTHLERSVESDAGTLATIPLFIEDESISITSDSKLIVTLYLLTEWSPSWLLLIIFWEG